MTVVASEVEIETEPAKADNDLTHVVCGIWTDAEKFDHERTIPMIAICGTDVTFDEFDPIPINKECPECAELYLVHKLNCLPNECKFPPFK